MGDLGSIPWLGGLYSPWSCKESDRKSQTFTFHLRDGLKNRIFIFQQVDSLPLDFLMTIIYHIKVWLHFIIKAY